MAKRHKLFDILFRTNDGRIVIAQKPNWAIWVIIVLSILNRFHFSDNWHIWTTGLMAAALMIWSIMELIDGVNLFRRLLGLAGALYALSVLLGGTN